ncbi:MAG: hypothetical protein EA398_18060 [Deltaproteobacteria bacterium]|nr:MAG: hypothetical protein EA398_18060 [Deltaproteobacteria bacterium]
MLRMPFRSLLPLVATVFILAPQVAVATPTDETESLAEAADEEARELPCTGRGLEYCNTTIVALRGTPLGLNLISDFGFRYHLAPDTDSDLFRGTYVEAGPSIGISPAYIWAGGYVQALPLAILQLRASAQYVNYWGYQGYNVPIEDPEQGWSLSDLSNAEQRDRITTDGVMLRGTATPRYRSGRIVVTLETDFIHIRMNELERDRNASPDAFVPELYHEPYFDIVLEPEDSILWFKPTLGYLIGSDLSNAYLLLAARWDRMQTSGSDISRDIAGLVYLWQLPRSWNITGDPQLSGFVGAFLDHPSRDIAPYFGTQYTMRF